MRGQDVIIKGNFICTSEPSAFSLYKEHFLVIERGRVKGIFPVLPEPYTNCPIQDYGQCLIMPGFVDLHTHAAQFNQRGLGMDLELLTWLEQYTFKEEARFASTKYAEQVYSAFVEELIRQGTTRVVVFGTIHKQSCNILYTALSRSGIGAYVGKVNMDAHCPDELREDTLQSLADTEECIQMWRHPLVKPIITPRFAVTSTSELLAGLGKLAERHQLPVQSHLLENAAEALLVAQRFPQEREYHAVYEKYHLFGDTPTLMAHCIHLTESSFRALAAKNIFAVHCPHSNQNLTSGIMPLRQLLERDVNVGLGTDVGAGHTLSMPQTIVSAIQSSKIKHMNDGSRPLTLSEAFYMATKGGGQFFGKVGSFEPGYEFDALIIDDTATDNTLVERLQQFIYTGKPEQIAARYVAGQLVDSGYSASK